MNSVAFLRVENLRKEFPKRGGPVQVLKGISFSLNRGEMLGESVLAIHFASSLKSLRPASSRTAGMNHSLW